MSTYLLRVGVYDAQEPWGKNTGHVQVALIERSAAGVDSTVGVYEASSLFGVGDLTGAG